MKPELLTNREGEGVGELLCEYLAGLREGLREPYELSVATAYFNLGGYQLVADELDHPGRVRVLLGAEPPAPERRVRRLEDGRERSERQRVRRALEEHGRDLRSEADLLGFTLEASRGAERLVGWLRSERVEVRRLPDRFLHGKAWIVNAGDSRAYRLSAGKLECLTQDHTWVREFASSLSPEQLALHPYRHVLTKAVGAESTVNADTVEADFRPGDVLLLCSDGLHGQIPAEAIATALSSGANLEDKAANLIRSALARGAPDNVTVVLVRCTEDGPRG